MFFRAILEKAAKNLSEKQMKPVSVASAVTANIVRAKSPVKQEPLPVKDKDKIIEPVYDKPKRRVFVDSDSKDQRKVSSKQAPGGNIQISVSASNTGADRKKVVSTVGDLRNKLNRDKVRTSDDQLRHDSPERRRDKAGDRGRDREDRYERGIERYRDERKKSRDDRDYKDRRVSRDDDKPEKVVRRISRKESVIDEAKFVPDYDDDSDSDNSLASSDSDSSSDDDSPRKRHKHKKTKHKKMKKHKKKEKKEKKKKKHKYVKHRSRERS